MSKKDEIERIATQLHSVAIHLIRHLRGEDKALSIPPARLSALSVIVFGGPRSLRSISEAEQVQPPTMSKVIDALVADGLVTREPDPQDRRGILISATEKGRRLMFEGRDRRVKKFVEIIEKLGASELQTLDNAAEILTGVLSRSRD